MLEMMMNVFETAKYYNIGTSTLLNMLKEQYPSKVYTLKTLLTPKEEEYVKECFYKDKLHQVGRLIYDKIIGGERGGLYKFKLLLLFYDMELVKSANHEFVSYAFLLDYKIKSQKGGGDFADVGFGDLEQMFQRLSSELKSADEKEEDFVEKMDKVIKGKIAVILKANEIKSQNNTVNMVPTVNVYNPSQRHFAPGRYCVTCQESPCMCSDPESSSSTW